MQILSKSLSTLTAAALVAAATDAAAQTPEPPPPLQHTRSVGFLLRTSLDFGGEELAEVSISDGSTQMLKGGGLCTVAAGLFYQAPGSTLAVEGTIGYKFDRAGASNGFISFTRVPVDLVISYTHEGLRLGGGPTLHFSPSVDCDAGLCGTEISIPLDSVLGGIAQVAYGFRLGNRALDLGARYTYIRYSGTDVPSFDGSSFGFFFGGWL
jgi:hypothetical protein